MPADAPASLNWIDIAIVMTYLVGIVLLGLWVSRGIHTSKDLFLAGKTLPWWAVGLSLVVSDIGAKDMVGLAADGYRFGAVMMNFDFIGCIFPVLIAAFIFMPYFWLSGIYTVPEYLGRRYNQSVRTIFALLWGVFMVGNVAIIFVSAAVMFESLLGWSFQFAVVLTAVVAGLITTAGGLRAVVVTEFVSCIILILGAALICIYGLQKVGGWSGLQTSMAEIPWAENHFDLIRPADDPSGFGWPAVLLGLGFVLGPSYWIGNQAIAQRALGSKSPSEARASYVFCALIKLFFPLLLVLPGMIGVVLYHDRVGVPEEYAYLSGKRTQCWLGMGRWMQTTFYLSWYGHYSRRAFWDWYSARFWPV